jgi:hypothetical protein
VVVVDTTQAALVAQVDINLIRLFQLAEVLPSLSVAAVPEQVREMALLALILFSHLSLLQVAVTVQHLPPMAVQAVQAAAVVEAGPLMETLEQAAQLLLPDKATQAAMVSQRQKQVRV